MKISRMSLAVVLIAIAAGQIACTKKESKKGVGINLANFDSTHTAQKNFFHFANGNWIKSNPIPSDQIRWGTFTILAENNRKNILKVAEDAAKNTNASKGSPEQLAGDFYFSSMDTTTIEKLGAEPIKGQMDAIGSIKDMNGILAYVAKLQQWGANPMFGFYAGQDPKNSEVVVPQIVQAGLSLPDRDFYMKDDARSKEVREEFNKHVTAMFTLYGLDEKTSKNYADVVMKIESALAKSSMTRVELRDPFSTYNKVTVADLNSMTPSLNWNEMLNNMEVKGQYDYLVLGQPEFLKELQNQLLVNSINDWQIYLKWHLLNLAGNVLSDQFVRQDFEFNNKFLQGQKELQPRWKRMVSITDALVGDALGQLYVAKYFPPDSKKKADELVSNLVTVYNKRIENLDWMSDVTKKKAKEKLNAITRKIGYPDKWKDYNNLVITRDAFFQNILNATKWNYDHMIAKIGKPVDRTQWGMTPPTVNAYYNPLNNEIVFPAGILQPPFFNPEADDAVNYGGIGMVIGHELTHGFDDEGRNYDAKGNLNSWWTSEDSAKFVSKADMVVKQYDQYTVLDTLYVNGRMTLGENIADIGGMAIAYDAFKLTKQGKSNELIDGLTPDQRFYLSFANVWASDMRPEAQAQRVVTDYHSPPKYRVNGTVCNLPEFHKAFAVQAGDEMYLPDSLRANIW